MDSMAAIQEGIFDLVQHTLDFFLEVQDADFFFWGRICVLLK